MIKIENIYTNCNFIRLNNKDNKLNSLEYVNIGLDYEHNISHNWFERYPGVGKKKIKKKKKLTIS